VLVRLRGCHVPSFSALCPCRHAGRSVVTIPSVGDDERPSAPRAAHVQGTHLIKAHCRAWMPSPPPGPPCFLWYHVYDCSCLTVVACEQKRARQRSTIRQPGCHPSVKETRHNKRNTAMQELLPVYSESVEAAARKPGKLSRTENQRLSIAHTVRLSTLSLPPSYLSTSARLAALYSSFLETTLCHVAKGLPGMFWEAQELQYCVAASTAALSTQRSPDHCPMLPPALRGQLWNAAKSWLCLNERFEVAQDDAAALQRERSRFLERIRDTEQKASTSRDVALCMDCADLCAFSVRFFITLSSVRESDGTCAPFSCTPCLRQCHYCCCRESLPSGSFASAFSSRGSREQRCFRHFKLTLKRVDHGINGPGRRQVQHCSFVGPDICTWHSPDVNVCGPATYQCGGLACVAGAIPSLPCTCFGGTVWTFFAMRFRRWRPSWGVQPGRTLPLPPPAAVPSSGPTPCLLARSRSALSLAPLLAATPSRRQPSASTSSTTTPSCLRALTAATRTTAPSLRRTLLCSRRWVASCTQQAPPRSSAHLMLCSHLCCAS
jgi:hypothetical protein